MSTVTLTAHTLSDADAPAWHRPLVEFLPLIRSTAADAFRRLPAGERAEAVADVVADCAAEFAKLADRGRPHFWLIPPLARFAVRKRRAGRRVGSSVNRRDVLSPARPDHVGVVSLESAGPSSGRRGGSWRDALPDSRHADPAELAAFNVDFEDWLATLTPRQRSTALALAAGCRPGEVATRLGLCPARVSQLRAELKESWLAFQGEAAGIGALAAAA